MSAAETGQMSAVETRQMSTIETGYVVSVLQKLQWWGTTETFHFFVWILGRETCANDLGWNRCEDARPESCMEESRRPRSHY